MKSNNKQNAVNSLVMKHKNESGKNIGKSSIQFKDYSSEKNGNKDKFQGSDITLLWTDV